MANSGGHFAQLVRVEKFLFVGHAKVTLGKLGRLMGGPSRRKKRLKQLDFTQSFPSIK